MSRRLAFAVSLLLALAASAGAYAVLSTAALRGQASKPQVASARALARRAQQLDAWAASLTKAARSRPPALPAVPRYAPVPTLAAAALGRLPSVAPVRPRAAVVVRRVVRAEKAARLTAAARSSGAGSGRFPGEPADPAPPPQAPSAAAPAPTPPPAPAAAPSAPPTAPARPSSDDGHDDGQAGGGSDD